MENISREINLKLSRNASDEALQLQLTERIVLIIQIIITITACPLTVLLNVSVILAVKKTPRLQSKANILLACLAATDAFIGLTAQPSIILVELFRFIYMKSLALIIRDYIHSGALLAGITNSLLHLMLVTFERLVAIKFTTHHSFLITGKNIKVSVAIFWIFALCTWALRCTTPYAIVFTVGPLVPSCIIFIAISVPRNASTQEANQDWANRSTKSGKFFEGKQGFKDNGLCDRLSPPLFYTTIDFASIICTWRLIPKKLCLLWELLSCAHYAEFSS